jgi:lantibiotic biosynthesis protein
MTGTIVGTELEAAARDIVRSLEATAVPTEAGLTWHAEIIVDIEGDTPVLGHGDVGPTLYDGAAGIAVALAAAGAVEVARGAAEHALAAAEALLCQDRLGLYDGATGIAVAALRVGRAASDDALHGRGVALARDVAGRLRTLAVDRPAGVELDLMGGLAGIALGLLELPEVGTDAALRASLTALGHWLADAAQPQLWGAAWSAEGSGQPLLGLAHGAAGIVLALGELFQLTDDQRLLAAIREGLEYERAWYDADRVGWPDLRELTAAGEPGGWMTAWCHGALGIGFSRLRLQALLENPLVGAEIGASLQAARDYVVSCGTSLRGGTRSDCSSCHGLSGVVELLLVAAHALRSQEHARAARRVTELLLEQRRSAASWPCGLLGAGEVPGLMTGTSGIAMTLLRVANATEAPTPLLPGTAGW